MFQSRSRLIVAASTTMMAAFSAPVPVYAARLAAELRPSRIYMGTQALLVVEVSDAGTAGWPSVGAVAGLDIQRYSRPSVMRDLFSGRTTHRYQFIVTPKEPGSYEIPQVSLTVGGATLKDGPFALRVDEAQLRFHTVKIDPTEILVGDTATLEVYYQGVRPGVRPVVPEIEGLVIRPLRLGRVEVTDREGLPVTIHSFEIEAKKLGSFQLSGITFDGVPAQPVKLRVSPFVVAGTQIGENSLVVGSRTTAHVLIRGLPQSTKLELVAPEGVRIVPSTQKYRIREAGSLFSFDVIPTEPGNFAIDRIKLPDGHEVALDEPLTLAVRQSGAGEIFACRGIPSSDETVVGEPFTVEYEVFFRGDFQGAAVDLSKALFANKDYINVEPINDVSYPDWQGEPIDARLGRRRIRMLLGSGEYNGQKEQLLRFALKITPLATGELSMEGLHVMLLLQIKEERRTTNTFFSSSQTKQYSREAEVPPHHVIDPPGITRPTTYQGAVGKSFAFVTELDRTSATAMSPLTLTMKISGESVGPQFAPPPLSQVPELTRDFDLSSTVHGGEVTADTITFTQVVRPRNEEVTELPALPLVYYDYEQKTYETVYSLPIPLEVRPGSLVGAAAMEAVSRPAAPPADSVTERNGRQPAAILGANYASLGDVVAAPLSFAGVIFVLIAGPASIIAIISSRWAYRQRQPLAAVKQRKRELVRALGSIEGSDDFYIRLAEILHSYLRLSFDLPPGELSGDALAEAFENARLSTQLRGETRSLLDTCDVGRFAGSEVSEEEKTRLLAHARDLFRELDRSAK